MTDILKHSANLLTSIRRLLSKKQILDLTQRPICAVVDKMVPSARVSVQHSRSFDNLSAILLPAPLAFERVVRVAGRVVSEIGRASCRERVF